MSLSLHLLIFNFVSILLKARETHCWHSSQVTTLVMEGTLFMVGLMVEEAPITYILDCLSCPYPLTSIPLLAQHSCGDS